MDPIIRSTLAAVLALTAGASATAANLNHYYDFSAGVIDLAGTQNGTLLGGASVGGGALLLDGVDDYVQFSNHLVPIGGSYSVALKARGNSVQAGFTELISQGFSGGPGFYIGTDNSGTQIRATDSWTVTGANFGAPNVWTHYALVVDAGANNSRLFVGGLQVALLPFAIVTTPAGSDTRLGRQFGNFNEYFNGAIDEVRIYDGVLTPGEVAVLAAVPEPGSALLALGGLALLAAVRRR